MSADLYGQAIKDLAAAETARLDSPDASATLDNPLCGDKVTLDVRLADDGRVAETGGAVKGCLLCKAAAAVLAERAPGLGADDAAALAADVAAMLKQGAEPPFPALAAFVPVRGHKSRHGCVLLPFKVLAKALGR